MHWWALVGVAWLGLGVYTVTGGGTFGYLYIALGLIGLAAAAVTFYRSRAE